MRDNSIFALMDREFFTSVEQRTPGPEYRSLVAGALEPGAWEIVPRGVWTYAHPAGWTSLRQGWKLHVSATPGNGAEVLERVARVLGDDPAAFKFASDPPILGLILSKNWPREGGGKFITVYPADDEQFQRLGRALAAATEELDGPYILSDRRVPGSRIVFYRYGEHLASEGVDPYGFRAPRIAGPAGEVAQDVRAGYYQLPSWVSDPYGNRPVRVLEGEAKKVTLNDRYEIAGAFKYSNMGGVYFGTDLHTGSPVVVRERRRYTGWIDDETDGVGLLRKEARILRAMDGTGWTPGFVEEFQVWEHHYVAMERVDAVLLRDYASAAYLRPRSIGSPRWIFAAFRQLILELVRGVEEFHRRGIVLRDLTVGNVLVRPDRTLCFIDFEYAWERAAGPAYAARIHTPGYASPEQMAGSAPTEADDFHSLGAIVVELCAMLAPGLGLNRDGMLRAAEMATDEVGLPRELLEVARGLLDPDPATRWDGAAVRRALGAVRASSIPWRAREPGRHHAPEALVRDGVEAEAAAVSEEVCAFFEESATPHRADRLWPGPPEVYRANPACIQYGACGPIELVRRVRGACPDAWLDWVERKAVPERCPPGLYAGRAGVALTLAACGRTDAARRILLEAAGELPPANSDLFYGAAGVGLAALVLGAALDDAELRAAALRAGAEVERRAMRRRRGLAWRAGDEGLVPCGLGAGGSGIALFFTYLGAWTGEERWWTVAGDALAHELAQAQVRGGYRFFPDAAGRQRRFWSPHVSFGTAGVCTAALRLHACTGDPALGEWAARCAETLTFRWTNKLWQDMGFAGWGETLLDMHAATGDAAYRGHALRAAEAILPTRVRTRFGTAFPGNGLDRVSSDFGMGASGVALFLHRLVSAGEARPFYFPDHLLPGFPARPSAVPASTPAATEPRGKAAPEATGRPRRARAAARA